jgi:hypothetical protein
LCFLIAIVAAGFLVVAILPSFSKIRYLCSLI